MLLQLTRPRYNDNYHKKLSFWSVQQTSLPDWRKLISKLQMKQCPDNHINIYSFLISVSGVLKITWFKISVLTHPCMHSTCMSFVIIIYYIFECYMRVDCNVITEAIYRHFIKDVCFPCSLHFCMHSIYCFNFGLLNCGQCDKHMHVMYTAAIEYGKKWEVLFGVYKTSLILRKRKIRLIFKSMNDKFLQPPRFN